MHQQNVGGTITTLQEGTFPIGDDMLYDRLQEHVNNYLRQMANRYTTYEQLKRR